MNWQQHNPAAIAETALSCLFCVLMFGPAIGALFVVMTMVIMLDLVRRL